MLRKLIITSVLGAFALVPMTMMSGCVRHEKEVIVEHDHHWDHDHGDWHDHDHGDWHDHR